MSSRITRLSALLLFLFSANSAVAKPLKVFILAGQSNMEGPASIATFDYIGDGPATAPLLKMMRGGDGKPTCDAQGFESSGISSLQGWNDMVDSHVYPGFGEPARFALYSELLAHFIRDVRKDLKAPKMPFVIGVMGIDGSKPGADIVAFREAMSAPSLLPEFKGNVVAVETTPFWSMELGAIAAKYQRVSQMRHFLDSKNKDHPNADGHMTDQQKDASVKSFEAKLISPADVEVWKRGASNAGFHYLGCAKTFALMGEAFAKANLTMMKPQKRP